MHKRLVKKILSPVLVLMLALSLTGCGETSEAMQGITEKIQNLDYQGALEDLQLAQESGEDLRLCERSRGIAYIGLSMYDEAIEAFLRCLSLSDGFPREMDYDTNFYLAAAYTKSGRYEEALKVYNAILDLDADRENAYFLRGNVEMNLGMTNEAIKDFDQAVKMRPKDYDMLIDIYEILQYFGQTDAAKNYLHQALSAEDKDMDPYVTGRIYYYLGDFQKASIALEEAKDKGGENSYLYLGLAYEAIHDYNYAASVYNSYLGKYEGSAQIYNQLGLCELQKKEYLKALNAFQTGKQLNDSTMQQSLCFNEIVAYERLGEFETAYELMGEYIRNYPDDEQAKREYEFLSTR